MNTLIEQGRVPIKLWADGVEVEHAAMEQIRNVASLPVVGPHVAIMPDAHWGNGACVGSVIPTKAAIIPAAVGVDLGCGMMSVKTDLSVNDLTGKLPAIREAIERTIPVGGPGIKGSWEQQHGTTPQRVMRVWEHEFDDGFARILTKHPKLREQPTWTQLGTLGTGNHFIEVCQDLGDGGIWFMLHSGSRCSGTLSDVTRALTADHFPRQTFQCGRSRGDRWSAMTGSLNGTPTLDDQLHRSSTIEY